MAEYVCIACAVVLFCCWEWGLICGTRFKAGMWYWYGFVFPSSILWSISTLMRTSKPAPVKSGSCLMQHQFLRGSKHGLLSFLPFTSYSKSGMFVSSQCSSRWCILLRFERMFETVSATRNQPHCDIKRQEWLTRRCIDYRWWDDVRDISMVLFSWNR